MTVYRPNKDTYLLLEHLKESDLNGKKFLEIGTGSGLIAVKACEMGAEVTATDINPEAIEAARDRAKEKGLEEEIFFIETDLFQEIDGNFDLIVFNPPYLPGKKGLGEEEIWRGGEKGIELLDQFLSDVRNFLSPGGYTLFITSSLSENSKLKEKYEYRILEERKIWFETLKLCKFE